MCTLSNMNLTSICGHKTDKIINYGFYFVCFSVCCKLSIISMYYFYNPNTKCYLNIFMMLCYQICEKNLFIKNRGV